METTKRTADTESIFLDLEDLGVKLNLLDLAIQGLGQVAEAGAPEWDRHFRPTLELLHGIQQDVEGLRKQTAGKVVSKPAKAA